MTIQMLEGILNGMYYGRNPEEWRSKNIKVNMTEFQLIMFHRSVVELLDSTGIVVIHDSFIPSTEAVPLPKDSQFVAYKTQRGGKITTVYSDHFSIEVEGESFGFQS